MAPTRSPWRTAAGATVLALAASALPAAPTQAAGTALTGVATTTTAAADRAIDVPGFDEQSFAAPTDEKPAVLWFWDRPQTEAQIDARLESMHAAGFTETVIFRWLGDSSEAFFSQAWFDRIEHLLSKSEELGMKVWLDDDAQFPSGAAGGLIVNGGTVGETTYAPRPDLKVKTLRSAGSGVRDGGRLIALRELFGSSVVLDDGEVVANAASVPGITLLRAGSDWTDYTASAEFRIINATAGFMVRSPDPANGYLVDVRSRDGGVDVWLQQNGAFSLLREGAALPGWNSSPDAVHDIDITVEGSSLRVTIDGTTLAPLSGLTHFSSGRVGMRVTATQHWRLRDLEVTAVSDGATLFANDFEDESSVSDFDTETEILDDVVTVVARPATGAGATDLDQVVDVTDDYLTGAGTWDAPDGRWRLEAYQSVARGGDRESYVDSMSLEAQELYLEVIFDEYAERFAPYLGTTLLGFADDEPEVGRHGDDIPPWSPDLGERLVADGEDLAKVVTVVHQDMGAAGDELRATYYRAMSDQWVDAYWKTKYEWAEEHGLSIISNPLYDEYGPAGRVHESGNLMTMHQWAQIPGTDLIFDHVERGWARNLPREPASVAHQLGRPLVYDELMGATGWDKTISDVRRGTAMSAVRGINKALFHATFDDNSSAPFPPVFADDNAWWKFVPSLAEWTGRLMAFGRHQAAAPTALVQMQRAAESAQRGDESAVDGPFIAAQRSLEERQVDFDLLDEGALSDDPANLAHAVVTEDGLQVGEMTYRTVVVPTAPLVSLEAMQRLRDFALAGGEVVLAGPAPTQELEGRDDALAAVVAELEAAGDRVVSTIAPAGAGDAAAGLGRAAVTLGRPSKGVRVLRFHEEGSTGYLLLNEGGAALSTRVSFPEAGVPALWDVDAGTVTEAMDYTVGASTTSMPMTLLPNVPVAVTVSPDLTPSAHVSELVGRGTVASVSATGDDVSVQVRSTRSGPIEVTATTGGTADVRTASATVPELPAEKALGGPWLMQLDNGSAPVTRPLASWTDIAPGFSGDATYTRTFDLTAADLDADWTLDLGHVAEAAVVEVNGTDLGELVRAPYAVDLGDALVQGDNTVRVTVTNTDANSRGNVLASGLLGPVSLSPYAVVGTTLTDAQVQMSAPEVALAADGTSADVSVTATNNGSAAVQVRASLTGEGWRGVPGKQFSVPAGGAVVVTGHGVPTDFVDNDATVDLTAELTGPSGVLDLLQVTLETSFAMPPQDEGDHIDLGDAASESAHALTASPTSGRNVEAGLTRRYGGYRVPDAWYEFDLAATPGEDLLVHGLETYNDMPQIKGYLVWVDGVRVATRSFSRPLAQEGTAAWRLLVAAEHVTGATVRVRLQSRTNPDFADPSLADVWATPVPPFTAPADDPDPTPDPTPTPAPTATPDPTADGSVVSSAVPTIRGKVTVGRKLRATDGTWNRAGLAFVHQWTRDGEAIAGATDSTYEVRAADIGSRLRVRVTATSATGQTGAADSARTALVAKVGTRTKVRVDASKVRAGRKVRLWIRVRPQAEVRVTGRVRLVVDGRTARTAKVRNGSVKVRLRLVGRGVKRVTVIYLGSDKAARSTSRVARVALAGSGQVPRALL